MLSNGYRGRVTTAAVFCVGTVTLSLVKYSVDSLDDNGKTVGTLGAFNTIGEVFGTEYVVDVAGSSNRELFVSDNSDMINVLTHNLSSIDNYELKNMIARVSSDIRSYEKGNYILTDDKAPVELLGMQVIDEMIKDEVAYYKEIYKRDGIKGLLNAL